MFTLPQLPYGYADLAPHISAAIMETHHTKHHQTYVDKLNAAVQDYPDLQTSSVSELIAYVSSAPKAVQTAIRNHGGGHYNHSLFWTVMSPDGGGEPSGQLLGSINQRYGSFQSFVDDFSAKALGVFGSGWAWLMPDLSIATTANQDNPFMEGKPAPILGLDVWEHAYYLDYRSGRADYVKAWWNVVNWPEVARRYEAAA